MRNKVLIFLALLLALSVLTSFASRHKNPEFRWQQLYRYDIRHSNNGVRQNPHQLYINRVSAAFVYRDWQEKELLKLTPFFEARWGIDRDLWERKEIGAEIGKDISPWLYLGEAIQNVWMNEDYRYYKIYEKRNYAESETRLLLSHTLLPKNYIALKGFILDEYTYDFNKGAGTRNEVAIGFVLPLNKHIETEINWRHIDRIHYYDSDTFEAAFTIIF